MSATPTPSNTAPSVDFTALPRVSLLRWAEVVEGWGYTCTFHTQTKTKPRRFAQPVPVAWTVERILVLSPVPPVRDSAQLRGDHLGWLSQGATTLGYAVTGVVDYKLFERTADKSKSQPQPQIYADLERVAVALGHASGIPNAVEGWIGSHPWRELPAEYVETALAAARIGLLIDPAGRVVPADAPILLLRLLLCSLSPEDEWDLVSRLRQRQPAQVRLITPHALSLPPGTYPGESTA